jgi:hypothetical protein
MLKIDSHTHILPKKMPNWSEKFGYGDFIYLQHHKKGVAKMMRGNQFFREIKSNCWEAEERIEEYKQFNTPSCYTSLDNSSLLYVLTENISLGFIFGYSGWQVS